MKKLLIGTMVLSSFTSFANTSTTTTENSFSKDKKFSLSLRRDVNLQVSGKIKLKSNGYSVSDEFGSNEVEGTTIAGAYTDKLNDRFMYDVGASFSKIDPTSSDSSASDYVEQLRVESNISSYITDMLSGFAGLNISKFTRGQTIVDSDAGLGFQFGLQATLTKSLKADLRYWETNNSGSEKQENVTMDYDYKISSTTLGVSYIF